jgi:ubiquinone/menaquinone biosynthesis C-methylase UbiE
MAMYEEYASVYDASGQLAFSLKMIPYLQRLLEHHPVSGCTLLELACGTGTVAVSMAEAGWRVYGIDGSVEMLAQARAKAEENGVDVWWSQQDMRHFVLPERAHLATCLYDSLNYMLTSEDLYAVFRRVHDALQPGGLFLFDMNTAAVMATMWNGDTYFTDSDDLSMIMRSWYDDRRQRATVEVTCFERVGALYRKIVERHTEQAYPEEHVATLLVDAGFAVEARYDCFALHAPKPSSFRIMWAARRPTVQ